MHIFTEYAAAYVSVNSVNIIKTSMKWRPHTFASKFIISLGQSFYGYQQI